MHNWPHADSSVNRQSFIPFRRPALASHLPAPQRPALLLLALLLTLLLISASGPVRAAAIGEQDPGDYANRLSVARIAYFKVIQSNDQVADEEAHAALDSLDRKYPGDAVVKAYLGSLKLLDAAHNWAIWNLHKQSEEGLSLLDAAVAQAPDEPEARFIRAATSWHLPGFYRRRGQCEADFALLASRAERDANEGRLVPELAAATYNYWGQILVGRNEAAAAQQAFRAAVRIAPQSPAGFDAARRLRQLS